MDLTLTFIIAQIIGAIGYALAVYATQFKKRTHLLYMEAFATSLIALQWLILSMPILAALNIGASIVCLLGVVREKHPMGEKIYMLSIPIMLGAILLGWENTWVSYLAAFSQIFYLSARFCIDMLKLRIFTMTNTSMWFFMNSTSGSIPGAISNLCYLFGHYRKVSELIQQRKLRLQTV